MKSVQFRRNTTIILSTFFGVILLYLFYTLFYIKNREEQLIQTRFRVLDQVAANLKSKVKSYQDNADIYKKSMFKNLIDYKSQPIKTKTDSLEIFNATMEEFSKVYNKDLHFKGLSGKRDSTSLLFRPDSLIIITEGLKFTLSNDLLLKNIDRKDVFEKFLIIGDGFEIYCTFSNDLKLVTVESVGKNGGGNKTLNLRPSIRPDTLFLPGLGKNETATLHSNRCYNISLSEGDYKLFLKPVNVVNHDWFIGGLVNIKEFNRQKQSVAPWLIIVLSLVLLMIILSVPFLKLKVMAKTEMLGTGTVVYAALAFCLAGSFLIFFLFFQAMNLSRIIESDARLKKLADHISKTLRSELDTAYLQLNKTDSIFKDTLSGKDKNNDEIFNIANILTGTEKYRPTFYKYFDYIFWLNEKGKAMAQITPFSQQEPLTSYPNRDYFKKKNEWYWYDATQVHKKFRMESIVSTTSGDYKVAFSRPSDANPFVVVMTGRFYSLIDPVLPEGYDFCIFDETGKVWFHSKKYRNLGENFIDECNGNKRLKAALYAYVTKSMHVSYYNNPHRIYVKPLTEVPLYLVTMYDLRNEYSYQAQGFVTTLILISGLFLYVLLQVFVLLLLKRIFKKDHIGRHFQLDIINYRPSKIAEYKRLIMHFFLAGILYFYLFIIQAGETEIVSIISILAITTVLFNLLFVYLQDFKSKIKAKRIFIFLNAIIFIAFLSIFINEFETLGDKNLWSLIIIMILILIIALAAYLPSKLFDKFEIKEQTAYSLLILFMVLLFGVAPILKFFDISVRLEDNIHIRYGQLELAKAREKRNEEFSRYYERFDTIGEAKKVRVEAYNARKETGIYTDFWYETKLDTGKFANASGEKVSSGTDNILTDFRMIYNDDFSVVSKYLLSDTAQNRSFKWVKTDSTLTFSYNSLKEDFDKKSKIGRKITTTLPELKLFNPFWKKSHDFRLLKSILLYSLIILILYLVFRLILFTVRQVFGVSLIEDYTASDFKVRLTDHMKDNLPVIVVNPSAFLGFKELAKKISMDFKTADFNWDHPELNSTNKPLLIINPFKDYRDPQVLCQKINIISDCLKPTGKLIILMEINPEEVYDFYKKKTATIHKPDPKVEKEADELVKKWHTTFDLFDDFMKRMIVLFVPVMYPVIPFDPATERPFIITQEEEVNDPLEVIHLELSAGDYLQKLNDPMEAYLEILPKKNLDSDRIKQLIITRISEMGGKYYRCLLDTCSLEEKLVLMDLALDSIANVKNKPVIIKLLRRGLLNKGKDSIELMNNSFRLFLVSNYSHQDKEQFKKALGIGPGSWTGYKYAIYLVIVAIFIFIFISNQEFLQNLNKMFVTLGASIAGIMSLLSLMGKKSKES